MPNDRSDASPDRLRLAVDGEIFDVAYDPAQPGAYHYSWVSGLNDGYGFSSRRSDHERSTIAEHEAHIRDFLSAVDPATGYIEDDPADEDEQDIDDDPGPGRWQIADRDGNVIHFPGPGELD
jgi:hypothetical protein